MEDTKDTSSEKYEAVFIVLAVFFCVNLVLTNVVAGKLFQVPFFNDVALSVGDITYPITFLITDIVAEIWGKRRARFIVFMGFFMNVFMLGVVKIALRLTPHIYWVVPGNAYGYTSVEAYQSAFESVFGSSFFLILASMVAYLISQLIDVHIFHFFKRLTRGKMLWLRNNGSTMMSQVIDTFIFWTIFLYIGVGVEFATCLNVMIASYCFKWLLALCDTPFCYLGVWFIQRVCRVKKEDDEGLQHAGGV
jgi:queuosine precursor transporter